MKIVQPQTPKPPEPKHDPKTMSYREGQKESIKTDRGEFAFRKNGSRD